MKFYSVVILVMLLFSTIIPLRANSLVVKQPNRQAKNEIIILPPANTGLNYRRGKGPVEAVLMRPSVTRKHGNLKLVGAI